MDKAIAIRTKVFVDEQKVPIAIEMDEFDATSNHILASWNDQPAGTARWRETECGMKLERFAVLKPYRGMGVGSQLVTYILNRIDHAVPIYLNAQESVIDFYSTHGFKVTGDRFFEADIPHKKMILKT